MLSALHEVGSRNGASLASRVGAVYPVISAAAPTNMAVNFARHFTAQKVRRRSVGENRDHRKSFKATPTSGIGGARQTFAHRHLAKAKKLGLGRFYVADANGVIDPDVDLEELATELGVMRSWETLKSKRR